jgi:hypothetical protein
MKMENELRAPRAGTVERSPSVRARRSVWRHRSFRMTRPERPLGETPTRARPLARDRPRRR